MSCYLINCYAIRQYWDYSYSLEAFNKETVFSVEGASSNYFPWQTRRENRWLDVSSRSTQPITLTSSVANVKERTTCKLNLLQSSFASFLAIAIQPMIPLVSIPYYKYVLHQKSSEHAFYMTWYDVRWVKTGTNLERVLFRAIHKSLSEILAGFGSRADINSVINRKTDEGQKQEWQRSSESSAGLNECMCCIAGPWAEPPIINCSVINHFG